MNSGSKGSGRVASVTPADGPAKTSPNISTIVLPSRQVASAPVSPDADPVSPSLSQPTPSHMAPRHTSDNFEPWTQAYEVLQTREPGLLGDYKKHLGSLQRDTTTAADLSTPQSVESIVKQLLDDREEKQWQVSLLGKEVKIRQQAERLAKFLLWSDPIVKGALSAQPYAALAWSGVSLLLPLLTAGTTKNEAMLEGFNAICDIQVYWEICDKTYLHSSHRQVYQALLAPLANLYSHIIEYQARLICHLSRAQLSRAWQNVAGWNDWDGKAAQIDGLSNNCSKCIPPLEAEEIRKARDSQLQEMQESRIILDEIRTTMEAGWKQIQITYEDQKERQLLHDLASHYEDYKDFNPPRVQGTCEWFFMDDRFRKWRDSNVSSLLWVSAGPGCGKSVLSRALIDERRLSTNVTTSTVCYFLFKDGDENRMYATNALCAILHQLFIHNAASGLIKHALCSHKNYGPGLAQNFAELWRILLDCADTPDIGEIICVLDALDECHADFRQQLIDKLKDFYCQPQRLSNPLSKLKFLITSRPYDDLEASFKRFSNTTAYLRFDGDKNSAQISDDINLFIDAKVGEIARDFEEGDRREISEQLKRMKQSTYLWLHLIFDIIEQSPSQYGKPSEVEKLLTDLPTMVSEAYEKILNRSGNYVHTETLLRIVLAAARPLTLDEANIALTLALHEQRFISHAALESKLWSRKVIEDIQVFEGIVKNLCGLFITVRDSKLFFIHQTAREFLVHPERKGKWQGRLNMTKSHSTMSVVCLAYLSLENFNCGYTLNTQELIHRQKRYPFLSYAAQFWALHGAASQFNDSDRQLVKQFFDTKCLPRRGNFGVWVQTLIPNVDAVTIETTNPLYYAASFGFVPVVKAILESDPNIDIDASGGRYGSTPLFVACWRDQYQVVEILLEAGADPHITDRSTRMTVFDLARRASHSPLGDLLANCDRRGLTNPAASYTENDTGGELAA